MPLNRTAAEAFSAKEDAIKDDIRTSIPATITKVYPARQTVDVQVDIRNPLVDQWGKVIFEPQESVSDVPLGVMRGGGFFVWIPVQVGDRVWLSFSRLSMDTWRQGQNRPGWVGKHTADSPIAIPCIAPDSNFFTDPNNDPNKVIIGKDGSAAQIRISATDIELGNNATGAVGIAAKIDTAVTTIVNAFNAHTHTVPITGAAGTTPTTPPSTTISGPPSTASALVKINPT
jgi:hypothetical protein